MSNNSDALNARIEDIRERIEYIRQLDTTYRADLNERETQAYAVLPILRALGWDDSRIKAVKFEYPTGSNNRVDIVLLLPGGDKIFIETKPFQASLSRRDPVSKMRPKEQLQKYLHDGGVRQGVLTNGREWRFYEKGTAVSPEMGLLKNINFINGDRNTIIDSLIQFLSKEQASGEISGSRKTAQLAKKIRKRRGARQRSCPPRRPETIVVFWRKRKVNSWRDIMRVFLAEAYKKKPEEFLINVVRRRPERFVESSEEPTSIKIPLQIPDSDIWVSGRGGGKTLWGVCESVRITLDFSEKTLRWL